MDVSNIRLVVCEERGFRAYRGWFMEMDEVKKVIHKRHRDPSQTVIINLTEKELRSLRKGNETASKLMNIAED